MEWVKRANLRIGVGSILVAGVLLLAACSSHLPDDNAITTHIQAKLFDDSVLKMRDIHVTSEQGDVKLSGIVNTDLEKAAVERIANQTEGVKTVDNRLEVGSPSSADSAPTASPTQAAESTPPESSAPPTPREDHARGSGHHHQASSSNNDEASAGEVSAQETQSSNSPEMTAQQAPPAPTPVAAAPAAPPVPPAPAVKPPEQFTVPSGTVFSVRLIDSVDSAQGRAGDEFAATVDAPVMVGDRVVIPRSSDARLRLVQATSAGRMTGRSDLKLELVSVTTGGQKYDLETGYYEQAGASRSTRTAETVGGGAVLGALIGAIAGRGRGAAIGSVAGAGAGTAAEASTHGQQVKLPSESKLSFTLKNPLTVTINPPPS